VLSVHLNAKSLLWTVIGMMTVGLLAADASAQQNGARIYEEELRVSFDQQRPWARENTVDFGAWFNVAWMNYDDAGAQRNRTLRQYQIRPWASMNLKGVHQAYVRGIIAWDDWNRGDNPTWWRESEFEDTIERAWYSFDLGQLLSSQAGKPLPWGARVKVGRQYTTIGSALTLATPLDAVRFDVNAWNWQFMSFLGKTPKHSANIDLSPAIPDQERCMYGFQLTYRGLTYHRPFAYYFAQFDHSSPNPGVAPWTFQRYDYSTRYAGIGSTGTLFLRDLSYVVELAGEWGDTYSRWETTSQDSVCAMAFDLQLEYLFRVKTHPRVSFEYLYGSGDGDRGLSSVTTLGGNRPSTKDEAFNGFGFRDTGIAYAPRISNLHMLSFGAKFLPLEDCELFRKLEVGTRVYFYMKDKNASPTSDATAYVDAQWLGWEWDVFMNWRITSDLSATMRYGCFQPGAAYEEPFDTARHFVYAGVTLSL
jgi:hypothetical protein